LQETSKLLARGMKPSLDWLLIFVPVAVLCRFVPAMHNDVALFAVSGLAIIPLAGWMGKATEHLAARTGQGIGGLLNATFGNAAELIIALVGLSKGLTSVVKASITGSILGNLLLVLGLSVFMGGLKKKHQTFNGAGARVSATTLLLATVGLLIPTIFHVAAAHTPGGWTPRAEQQLSLAIAAVLILSYVALLVFSLRTHSNLFAGEEHHEASDKLWSVGKAVGILLAATAVIAVMSEFLVGTIETAQHKLGLTEVFVGVVVVAIIGNAAEHSTAVFAALKDKMDLSLGIAIGSSLQIALFVAPVLLFASYLFGAPMNLEVTLPEVFAVAAAVMFVVQICGDGESNWLEGAQLLAVYLIVALGFFFIQPGGAPH
jgi:Ca2+:H+ antiporter